MTEPPRGFERAEFAARLERAQAAMAAAGLSALLFTTEPEVRYFSGFLTRFWESPTRPWFLVVPASGGPIAVIPSIGAPLMARTWVRDIRAWRAPDLTDDGVGLLAETLREVVGPGEAIGLPMGHETHLRMPLADYMRLGAALGDRRLTDDAGIARALRMVKSEAEIAKIRHACAIAGRAFARLGEAARPGVALSDAFRRFRILCLEEGADETPYLAGGAGPDGYDDVISPAGPRPLERGDVLMLDTGLVWDGYFCDFDRNVALGPPRAEVAAVHARLVEAAQAGAEAARPGARACDVHAAMLRIDGGADPAADPGRLGHGLGMQLTEAPSLIAEDRTTLREGMVLTIEPSAATVPGRLLVHEENIVVRAGGAEPLSPLAPARIPILEAP